MPNPTDVKSLSHPANEATSPLSTYRATTYPAGSPPLQNRLNQCSWGERKKSVDISPLTKSGPKRRRASRRITCNELPEGQVYVTDDGDTLAHVSPEKGTCRLRSLAMMQRISHFLNCRILLPFSGASGWNGSIIYNGCISCDNGDRRLHVETIVPK